MSDLFVFGIDIFGREGHAIVFGLLLFCDQKIVFGFQQIGAVIDGDLEIVSVRDRVLWAGFDAEPTKYAAAVIDVVDLCITLIAAYPVGIRTRVRFGLDVNAVRRTSGRAQVTRNAFFLAGLIDMQEMLPAVTGLYGYRLVRILHRPFLAWDL